MKRSFYQILEVPRDADQAQLDAAYGAALAKASAAHARGVDDAKAEEQLIRDGYQLLSDGAKRARYDAKLMASETGVDLMFFPEEGSARKKLGVETIIFATLAAVLGGIIYYQLSHKVEEVRLDYVQSVVKRHVDENRVKAANQAQPVTPATEVKDKK